MCTYVSQKLCSTSLTSRAFDILSGLRSRPNKIALTVVALSASIVAHLPTSVHAAKPSPPEFERSFISIKAELGALSDGLMATSPGSFEQRFAAARASMADDPIRAGALLRLLLDQAASPTLRAHVHLEIARADLRGGGPQSAMQHFVRAAELSRQTHVLAAAVEGFLSVAEQTPSFHAPPPVTKYVEALAPLDTVARETIYSLGKLLLKSDPSLALKVLPHLNDGEKPADPQARRARYLMGVARIKRGDLSGARDEFLRAAEAPAFVSSSEHTRDVHVRDLAWLAVGRLAFEAGDTGAAIHAYHQIEIHSPRFGQAFYELGWLALENGQDTAAMHAFAPLAELDPEGDLGRTAELMEGHVMLHRRDYDAAEKHYEAIARRFEGELQAFEGAVSEIEDLTSLTRDCDTRTLALANRHLRPVLEFPQVEVARRMTIALEEAIALSPLLARELELVEAIGAGRGDPNLLKQLGEDRSRILEVLEQLEEASLMLDGVALSSPRWLAGDGVSADSCCDEPRLRVRQLRELTETLLQLVDTRHDHTQDELAALATGLKSLIEQQTALEQQLELEVAQTQREAVSHAIADRRRELRTMVLEGDSGVLEAVWRFKEDHRERIGAAEQARKRKLDALYTRYQDSVGLWDGP